jgi:hypothetical protein
MGQNKGEREMKRVISLVVMLSILILFVNLASAMTVTINVPEKYSEVSAGEKVYFETEVKWPENTGRKDLRIEYTIKDKNNQTIAYLKVLKAIETQASFMDSISLPESTKAGTYAIFLTLNDYGQLEHEVAASFRVAEKQISKQGYYPIAIVAVGILVSMVLIFFYKKLRALFEKLQIKIKVGEIIKKRKNKTSKKVEVKR